MESTWIVKNYAEEKREGMINPDGKIDPFLFVGRQTAISEIDHVCHKLSPIATEYIFKQVSTNQ